MADTRSDVRVSHVRSYTLLSASAREQNEISREFQLSMQLYDEPCRPLFSVFIFVNVTRAHAVVLAM